MGKPLFLVLVMLAPVLAFGQTTYKDLLKESDVTLEGKTLHGFTMGFGFSRPEVRKGWWAYARKIGAPDNMRTYYKVKIKQGEGKQAAYLTLYSKTTTKETQGVDFFLGSEDARFKDQVQLLLIDFEKNFKISKILDQIKLVEIKSGDLAALFSDTREKDLLAQLIACEKEIETYKNEIKKIERK